MLSSRMVYCFYADTSWTIIQSAHCIISQSINQAATIKVALKFSDAGNRHVKRNQGPTL